MTRRAWQEEGHCRRESRIFDSREEVGQMAIRREEARARMDRR